MDWAKQHAIPLAIVIVPILAILPGAIALRLRHRETKLVTTAGVLWLAVSTWMVWNQSNAAVYAAVAWVAIMLWAFSAKSQLR